MVIRVYISGNSGNKEIVTHQQRIFMILNSLGIPNEPVDISAPGMENERDFMREKCKKKEGQRHALPPQIFNDKEYRGTFEDFDIANEDDVLEEFLGIVKKGATQAPEGGTATDQATPKPHAEAAPPPPNPEKLGAEESMETETAVPDKPVEPVQEAAQPVELDHEEPASQPPEEKPTESIEPEIEPEPEDVTGPEIEMEMPDEIPAGVRSAKTTNVPVNLESSTAKKNVITDDNEDHEMNSDKNTAKNPENPVKTKLVEKIICPGTEEYDLLMQQITKESEENNIGVLPDIPALGPSLLPNEMELPPKKPIKLVIEVDEAKASAGFQNIMNAGRFWRASQLIGTP